MKGAPLLSINNNENPRKFALCAWKIIVMTFRMITFQQNPPNLPLKKTERELRLMLINCWKWGKLLFFLPSKLSLSKYVKLNYNRQQIKIISLALFIRKKYTKANHKARMSWTRFLANSHLIKRCFMETWYAQRCDVEFINFLFRSGVLIKFPKRYTRAVDVVSVSSQV